MRRALLIGHADPEEEQRLVKELRTHEPVEAYREAGLLGCSIFAGKGHIAVLLETEEDFQSAYRRLLEAPSWRALFYKIEPLTEDLPSPEEFSSTAHMPFSGEITRWPPEDVQEAASQGEEASRSRRTRVRR
jgi:hypothetical protein